MASFQTYQTTLKTIEGGYQATVADKGNYNSLGQLIGTNHGISAIALEEYLGRVPSVWDMKNLSHSTALLIFKKEYWDSIKGDFINSQAVAETFIDHAVNSYPPTAIKIMQKVLNEFFGKNLVVDGRMGPLVLAAVNSVNANDLFVKFSAAREAYYRSLSKFSTFGTSWLNRIQTIAQKFDIDLQIIPAYGVETISNIWDDGFGNDNCPLVNALSGSCFSADTQNNNEVAPVEDKTMLYVGIGVAALTGLFLLSKMQKAPGLGSPKICNNRTKCTGLRKNGTLKKGFKYGVKGKVIKATASSKKKSTTKTK